MDLSEVKITLRALLMSCKDGLTVMQLMKDFNNEEGCPLPFKDFGFDSIFEFLLSIPDVLTFQRSSHPHMGSVLLPVASSKTSHLAELVAGQKNNQKKRSKSMHRHSFYDKFKSQHHNNSQTYGSSKYNSPREQSQWSRVSTRSYTPNRTSEYHHHNSNEHYSKKHCEKPEDSQSWSKCSSIPQNDSQEKENDPRSRSFPRSRSSPNHLEYKSSTHQTDCTAETPKHDKSTDKNTKTKSNVPSCKESHTTPHKGNSHLTANGPPKSNSQTNSCQTNSTENQSTSTNPAKPSTVESVSNFLSHFTQKSQSAPPQSVPSPAQTQQTYGPCESLTLHQNYSEGAAVFKSVPSPIQDGAQCSEPRYLQQMHSNVPNPQYNIDQQKLNVLMNPRKCGLLPTPLQNISKSVFNAAHSIQQAPWNKPSLSQQGYLTNNMTQNPPQPVPLMAQSSMQQAAHGSYLNNQMYGFTSHLNQPSHPNMSLQNQLPLSYMIQKMSSNVNSSPYSEAISNANFESSGLDLSYVMQHRLQRAALTSSAENRPPPSSGKFVQPVVPPGFDVLYQHHTLMTSLGNQPPVHMNLPFDIPIPGDLSMDSESSLPPRPPSVPISSSLRPSSSSMLDDPGEAYVKSLLESSASDKDTHSFHAKKNSSTSETPATLKMLESLNKSAHHSRPPSPAFSSAFTCSTPTPSTGHASSSPSDRVDREILFVGKRMRENLIALMHENPDGIRCSQLPNLYETKYQVPLKYREYGTPSMFSFAEKLPTVFKIVDLSSGEDWMLFDPEKEVPAKYLHRDLIPAAIEEALLKILRRCRNGFFLDEFKAKYELYYRRPINLSDYPAFSWTDVVAHFSVAKKLARVTQVGPRWFFRPVSKDAHLQPEHDVPAMPPGWELLKPQIAHYESTYVLKMDQLSKVKLPDVSKYDEVPIILQDGLSPHNLSAILANNKTPLDEMMDDLNEVYKALGEDELDMERPHITRGNVCMARYNGTDWHRCKILRVMDDSRVKLLFLDFGTVDYAPFNHLKYMMRDYSVLPIQCVYVSLYRVQPVNTDPQTGLPVWDRRGTDKLLSKYDNATVNATVFQYNIKEPRISCWITFLEADGKVAELNREYCEWGFGELDLSSIPSTLQNDNDEPDRPGFWPNPTQPANQSGANKKKKRKKKPPPIKFILPRLVASFKDLGLEPQHYVGESDSSLEENDTRPERPRKNADKNERFETGAPRHRASDTAESTAVSEDEMFEEIPIPGDDDFQDFLDRISRPPVLDPEPDSDEIEEDNCVARLSDKPVLKKKIFSSDSEEEAKPCPEVPPVLSCILKMEKSSVHTKLAIVPATDKITNTPRPEIVAPTNKILNVPPPEPLPFTKLNIPPVHKRLEAIPSTSRAIPPAVTVDYLPQHRIPLPVMPVAPSTQNSSPHYPPHQAPPNVPARANIGVVPEDAQLMEVTYRRRDGFQVTETYMGNLANHPYSNQQSAATHHQMRGNRHSLDSLTDDSPSQPLTSVPGNNMRAVIPNPAQLSNQHLNNNHQILSNPVQLSNQYLNNNPPVDLNPTRLCNPLLNNNLGGALSNASLSNLRTPTLDLKEILDNIALGVSKNANPHAGNKVLNSSSAARTADHASDCSGVLMNQNKNQVLANLNHISQNMSRLSVSSKENTMELSDDYPSGSNHSMSRNIQNQQQMSSTSCFNEKSMRENSYNQLPPSAVLAEIPSRNHAVLRDTINENAMYKESANRIDMLKESNHSETVKRKVFKATLHETLTPANAPVEKNLYYAGANAILDTERAFYMKIENMNEPLRHQDNRPAEWSRQDSTNRKYDLEAVKPLNTQPSNQNIQSALCLKKQGNMSSGPCSSTDDTLQKNIVSNANSSAPYRPPHYHLHSLSSDMNDPATTGNPNTKLNGNSQPILPTQRNSLNVNSDKFFPKNCLNPVSEEFFPKQFSTKCKLDNASQTHQSNVPIQNIVDSGLRGQQIPNSNDTNPMGPRTKEIPSEIPASQFSTKRKEQPPIELLRAKTTNSLEILQTPNQTRKPSTTSQAEGGGGSVKSDDGWAIKSKCKYFVNIRRLENPGTPGCEDSVSLRAVVVNKTPLNVVVLGGPPRACLIVEQFAHHVLKTSSVNVLLKTLRSQDQEAILVKHTRDGSPALFERLGSAGKLPKELENSMYLMEVQHVRGNIFQVFRKDLTALQEALEEYLT